MTTIAVVPPEKVTVSPTSNSLVVAVYFKSGAVKLTTVPVAPLTLLVNVSSAVMVPDTVLRTAYLGNASVGADVKLIPCSIILNEVALPISSPYGMTVASAPSKAISDKSLPPCSNSILLNGDDTFDVAVSKEINLSPDIVAVGSVPAPVGVV